MRAITKYTVPFLFSLLVYSCNTREKKESGPTHAKNSSKERHYTFDHSGISLQWTAYKFTEKLGVSGTFDELEVRPENGPGTISDLLKDTEIAIHTHSVNSDNEIRDPKLRASFFKVLNTDTIRGKILNAENDSGSLELIMNKLSNEVVYKYALKEDTLHLTAHLNIPLWNGQEALDSLNKACYVLHTGTDGVSKLWPDVDVLVKIPIKASVVLQ